MIGYQELVILAIIIFLLFGADRITRIARSMGRAKREFEKGLKEGEKKDSKTETKTASAPAAGEEADKNE